MVLLQKNSVWANPLAVARISATPPPSPLCGTMVNLLCAMCVVINTLQNYIRIICATDDVVK